MITAIAAASLNNCIGKGGKIPWNVSSEFKHFKETTMGGVLLMGSKTADSIVGKKGATNKEVEEKLPGRKVVIISRTKQVFDTTEIEVIKDVLEEYDMKIFICGGGQIYDLFLPYIDLFIISRIPVTIEDGDTFLPSLDSFYKVSAEVDKGEFTVEFYKKA